MRSSPRGNFDFEQTPKRLDECISGVRSKTCFPRTSTLGPMENRRERSTSMSAMLVVAH